jgi:DNA-binding NarL/FixJ family response regulator
MTTRILIVEDNPVARSFLTRVVRESFSDPIDMVECASLASARHALAQVGQTLPTATPQSPLRIADDDFRLVLCALELVDGSGLELFEQLRRHPATKVATTLYSDDEHLFPALQFGADGYLLKEDRFEVLVEELQRVVRGQPTMSPAIARRVVNFFRMGTGQIALSTRESELLGHLSKGFTLKEIARVAGLRPPTINEHILSIYRKLAASSTAVVVVTESEDLDG